MVKSTRSAAGAPEAPCDPSASSAPSASPVPPVVLVLGAIVSVQFGGAMAVLLLPLIGVLGSVTLRLVLAAALLAVIVRPRLRGRSQQDWLVVTLFALVLTAMNVTFYASLDRLPIGVAVTIEFMGPLALAATLSRRVSDGLAVIAALCGVVFISEVATAPWSQIDLTGVFLAMLAGVFWAGYILTSARTGAHFDGLDGIAIALLLGALVMAPIGIATAGPALLDGRVLLLGLAVALLSSAIPYSLELLALRHLAAGVFGVLLSLEPAVAALAGLLILGQTLSMAQLAGMVLVVLGSIAVLGRPAAPGHTEPVVTT